MSVLDEVHVANAIEPSTCGGDAALRQITFTICLHDTALITDHFSSAVRAVGPVCVSVCVHIITLERNDFSPRYLAGRFILTLPGSRSKSMSRSQEAKYFAEMVGATSREGCLVVLESEMGSPVCCVVDPLNVVQNHGSRGPVLTTIGSRSALAMSLRCSGPL